MAVVSRCICTTAVESPNLSSRSSLLNPASNIFPHRIRQSFQRLNSAAAPFSYSINHVQRQSGCSAHEPRLMDGVCGLCIS